jgi:hypothetical protein
MSVIFEQYPSDVGASGRPTSVDRNPRHQFLPVIELLYTPYTLIIPTMIPTPPSHAVHAMYHKYRTIRWLLPRSYPLPSTEYRLPRQ